MRYSSRHLVLLAGGWFATAVIAYSLGKVGAGDGGGQNAAANRTDRGPIAAEASGSTASASSISSGALEQGKFETIEQVTGGEPLDDWMKRLAGMEDEILRTETFLRLLSALKTPEELQAALKALKAASESGRFSGMFGMRESAMLLQKWTQLDPKGAFEFARSADGQRDRWFASSVVMGTWARVNPDEALAQAQSNAIEMDGNDGNWALASVVAQFSKSDLDRALQIASTQDSNRARGIMIEAILTEMIAQRGGEAARNTVLSLPAGSFRDNLATQLARRLADKDAPGTAGWVMSALPAGDARNNALAATIGQWVRNDAVAAGEFLSRLPPSPAIDAARERYAYGVMNADPEGALAWAGTITGNEQRGRTMEALLNNWLRRDKAAAQKWAATAQLPEELKAKVLRN